MAKSFKLLLIIVLVITAVTLYKLYAGDRATLPILNSTNSTAALENISHSTIVSAAPRQTIDVAVIKKVVKTEAKTDNLIANRPSIEELKAQYSFPLERRIEFFKEVLAEHQNEATGYTRVMLASIIESCNSAPRNKAELSDLTQTTENVFLKAGLGNGEIVSSNTQAEKSFKECTYIRERTTELSARQLYLEAAYINNNARAKIHLAISPMDADFDNWDTIKKEAHILEMTDLIDTARIQCDPQAFLALSAGRNWGEGKYWASPEPVGMPKQTSIYANVLAYKLYFEHKTSDAQKTGLLGRMEGRLSRLASKMSATELQNAKSYGQGMYQQYCAE